MSDSLQLYGPQHARLLCPSLSSKVCSNSNPLSWRCHPTISSSVLPCSPAFSLPSSRVFSNGSAHHIRWPIYWSFRFSISPSKEYSGVISLRVDWFDFLLSKESQESSPAPEIKRVKTSMLSLLYGPALTTIHDYWKNHSFNYVLLY